MGEQNLSGALSAAQISRSDKRWLVATSLNANIDLGGDPVTPIAGSSSVAFGLYDPSGTHVFSNSLGDAFSQELRSAALDGADRVLLTGTSSQGTLDLGGGEFSGAGEFLAVFGPNGVHLCSQGFGNGIIAGQTLILGSAQQAILIMTLAGDFESGPVAFSSSGERDLLVLGIGLP